MSQDRTTLLASIAKLLAVTTERGSSEAEAAYAAQRVRILLDRHNLSMLDINLDGTTTDADKVDARAPQGKKHCSVHPWEIRIAKAIAKLYDCSILLYHNWERIGWVGTSLDTEICQEVYAALSQQVRRLRKIFMTSRSKEADAANSCKVGFDYATGLAHGLDDRIQTIITQRKVTLTSSLTSLVVVKDTAVKNWIAKNTVKAKPQHQRATADMSAFFAGRQDASKLQINRLMQ